MATLTGFNHAPSLVLFVSVLGSMLGQLWGRPKMEGVIILTAGSKQHEQTTNDTAKLGRTVQLSFVGCLFLSYSTLFFSSRTALTRSFPSTSSSFPFLKRFWSCILPPFLFALSGVVSTGFSPPFLLLLLPLLLGNSAAAVPLGPTGGSRYWGGIHFCPVSAAWSAHVPVGVSSVVLVSLLFLSVYSSSFGRRRRRRRGPWQ